MHIETPVRRYVEHVLRQDQTISGDYHDVGLQSFGFGNRGRVTKCFRLQDRDVALFGIAFHRARRHAPAAARWSVWLGINSDDGMSRTK